MGINADIARFLLGSLREGASFQSCATLGRQNYNLGNRESSDLLKEYGFAPEKYPKLFSTEYSRYRYSEDFWEMLGTKNLETVDASAFEGATFIHDMNFPIPDTLKRRFDAVCDFGTLEHIFNFPTAIGNCLQMLKVGGHFFAALPANNYFGHGFYQFGPELFYRIFTENNGFRLEQNIAVESGPRYRWFSVADAAGIQAKGALVNSFPVILLIRARKIADVPLFQKVPQQSDFVAQWTGEATPEQSGYVDALANAKLLPLKRFLLENAPGLARFLEALRFSSLNRICSFRNRLAFLRINKRKWGSGA